jgi:hypothetical protein
MKDIAHVMVPQYVAFDRPPSGKLRYWLSVISNFPMKPAIIGKDAAARFYLISVNPLAHQAVFTHGPDRTARNQQAKHEPKQHSHPKKENDQCPPRQAETNNGFHPAINESRDYESARELNAPLKCQNKRRKD